MNYRDKPINFKSLSVHLKYIITLSLLMELNLEEHVEMFDCFNISHNDKFKYNHESLNNKLIK